VGNQNNNRQIDIHIFSFHPVAKRIEGVSVFFTNQGKILPLDGGHNIFKKQEFLAPMRSTLLLDEVLCVTKEFLMDFYYLGQCFCYSFIILTISSTLFFINF
jgi:hypothetical protein